ncbi:MAG: alpha-glucan family phosphorylase [Acidobacteria bacterium]|nr:alpha-glucan family phosphorylase [Acidobacteriota bacterium]
MKVEIPTFPYLPKRFGRLGELAYNLWWSWNAEARSLFREIDRTLWRRTHHNPIQMLKLMSPEVLAERAEQTQLMELYDLVLAQFDQYMAPQETWFSRTYPDCSDWQLAYFCAEFGVHSSLPIYSGGLGLLAGDTCKEASDLGIPMVAIGFLYPQGYFHQHVGVDGQQEAVNERLNAFDTPVLPLYHENGERLLVSMQIGTQEVKAAIWKVQVGRVPTYLMETDILENEPAIRNLSAQLYGGDQRMRLQQEILLGIGGVRVLRALGYSPSLAHLNEGHAAFAGLEFLREKIQQGKSFEQAFSEVRSQMLFTTHTPVNAGHDVFSFSLIEEYLPGFWNRLGLSREEFLNLGASPEPGFFSMTILAFRLSAQTNAVSRRHGETTRTMWHFLWPHKSLDEVPIDSVTNGVHAPSWIALELLPEIARYVGADWVENQDSTEIWNRVLEIPDDVLWAIHFLLKNKLLSFVRERARRRWVEDRIAASQVVALGGLLNPHALTIGFARRFATYKRATLVLQDRERLKRILQNPWMPVQIIFAGKAHPADEPGKLYLQQIYQACSSPELGGHLAFIEDYDKQVAYRMVCGVDVWLNTPRPPLEASGTSGQKAAFNGVPNLSVSDGWWAEGYNGNNGWTIESDSDDDRAVAENLYDLLEYEIVPLFYKRDAGGIPRDWVRVMKEAMRSAAPFSARRMLKEYVDRFYRPKRTLEEVVQES